MERILFAEYFDLGFIDPQYVANLMRVSFSTRLALRGRGFFDSIAVFQLYYFNLLCTSQPVDVYKKDVLKHFLAIHDDNKTLSVLRQSVGGIAAHNALAFLFFEDDKTRFNFNQKTLRKIVLCESPRYGPYALTHLRITRVQLMALGGLQGPLVSVRDLHLYNLGIIHPNDLIAIFPNVSKLSVTGCYNMEYYNLLAFYKHVVKTKQDFEVF